MGGGAHSVRRSPFGVTSRRTHTWIDGYRLFETGVSVLNPQSRVKSPRTNQVPPVDD
jgi:hypothetical protein